LSRALTASIDFSRPARLPTRTCPGWRNYATYAYSINFTTGTQSGDWGDDIVWLRVANNQWNSIQVGVQCRYSTPQGRNFSIYPTRYGETFWFGYPGGTSHN
jgi:hypothetical protein